MMPVTETDAALRHELARAFAEAVMPRINAELAASVAGLGRDLGGLDTVIAHAVGTDGAPGRRWRPLLGLAAAAASGGSVDDAIPVAVAVELTHTASLVLDDLPCMDDSALRRGAAATHREVGAAGAILVAVGLLGRAAELIGGTGDGAPELGAAWGRMIGLLGMSGGQAIDLAASTPPRGAARRLHRQKTVALCVFALAGPARAAGASAAACDAFRCFAADLGWAYQLADDAADLVQDGAIGRPSGGRQPLRQSGCLMRRAERRLRDSDVLDRAGLELMIGLGRTVVPVVPRSDAPFSMPPLRRSEPAC